MRAGMTLTAAAVTCLIAHRPVSAATVDGMNIHWTSRGNAVQTVLFVHGWVCDHTMWDAQERVITSTHRVITVDLPGHGRSDSPRDNNFSLTLFARAVEAVRREANVDRLVLVGHGLGVPVIREYARRYPNRAGALVLVDGTVFATNDRPVIPSLPWKGPEARRARENLIQGTFTSATPAAVRQRILAMMMKAPGATAAGAMAAMYDPAVRSNEPVTVPVLGLYGEGSEPMVVRPGMTRIFPTLEYHEIAGTGHFLMMEKPDEFNRLLSSFLGRVAR